MDDLLQRLQTYLRGMWHRRWIGLAFAWLAAVIGVAVALQIPDRSSRSEWSDGCWMMNDIPHIRRPRKVAGRNDKFLRRSRVNPKSALKIHVGAPTENAQARLLQNA